MNSDIVSKPSVVTNNDKGLEIKRISKSYNNRPVVREVSFNICLLYTSPSPRD